MRHRILDRMWDTMSDGLGNGIYDGMRCGWDVRVAEWNVGLDVEWDSL